MHRIFVYGTLKRGHGNAHYLQYSRFLSRGATTRPFMMLDAGFPVVMDSNRGEILPVQGEIYFVDDRILASLDRLESNGRMYNRSVQMIHSEDGDVYPCEMYLGDPGYWSRHQRLYPQTDHGTYNWRGR